MIKKYFIITLLLLTINQLIFAQNIEARVFEPEKVEVSEIYKNHSDISMNILLRDKRTSNDLFRDQIFTTIEYHFKESFPETKLNIIGNTNAINLSEPNPILVIIDIMDYFVAKRTNKWIGKTTFEVKIFDYQQENIKEYSKQIQYIETKPNRQSLQSAKQALASSFNQTVIHSKKFIEQSIIGEKEYKIVN